MHLSLQVQTEMQASLQTLVKKFEFKWNFKFKWNLNLNLNFDFQSRVGIWEFQVEIGMQVLQIVFKLLLRGVKSTSRIQMKISIFKFRLKRKFWRSYFNIYVHIYVSILKFIFHVSSSTFDDTSVSKIILKWSPRGCNLNIKSEIRISNLDEEFQCSGWKSWTSYSNIITFLIQSWRFYVPNFKLKFIFWRSNSDPC